MMPLTVIGDLSELKDVLNLVDGFDYETSTLQSGKNASQVHTEKQRIPARRRLEWMDRELLVELCEFVAMDYALFAFENPR
jgi:hypothetical protein